MKILHSYKDLEVWKLSIDLVELVYDYTNGFPAEEKFGLISQMRRCSISIPSNIAEGRRRGSRQDYRRFILIAYGSGAELETQLIISQRLKFGDQEKAQNLNKLLDRIMRMTNGLLRALKNPPRTQKPTTQEPPL